MKRKYWLLLGIIFVVALLFRFYAFRESIYFAYDQARDAFEAQDIYVNRNIKILGLPATGNMGIYHGPLFWYMTGPMYLLFHGDPAGVSAIFRVINALGVILIFVIASKMINKRVGLMAAFLYAISFEETQYAFYVGNPTLGVIFIPLIYLGALLIYQKSKYRNWSLILMFGSAAAATQMNLMFAYNFGVVLLLLVIVRKQVKELPLSAWVWGILSMLLILSSYFLAEIKFNFRETKTAIKLLSTGFGVMSPGQSKYLLFWDKYLTMYKDNFFGILQKESLIVWVMAIVTPLWLIYKARKSTVYRILLVWIFSWALLMMLGGHTGYYTNAGIGVGIIIGVSSLIMSVAKTKMKYLIVVVLVLFVYTNALKVTEQSPKSLITEMISQTGMKLADEHRVIDQMYAEASGSAFTIRETGVPYKIQTVWAYLFNQYALPKYGYLPYWENGNTLGFPGKLPTPINGTTCIRYLLREPTKGLPGNLIEGDVKEENKFSAVIKREEIGDFLLEVRQSTDKVCHNTKPI